MKRAIVLGIIALLAPAVAEAEPIIYFTLFGGNQVAIGTSNSLVGLAGSNGTITVNTGSSTQTIMGGGVVLEKGQVSTLGSIISSTSVTIGVGDHVTGDIDSGGNVIVKPGAQVDGSIRAAGTVFIDNGARVDGNVDAGQSSGVAVTLKNSFSAVGGTVTHKAGTTVQLAVGSTIGSNVIGTPATPTPYVTTVIPAATSFSSGANSFTVPLGGSLTLLPSTSPATTYNDILVASQATLHLVAGTYYFDTWTFDNNAKLDLDLSAGNIQLYFTGDVLLKSRLDVTGVGAGDVSRIYAETLGDWNITGEWFGTIFGSGATSKVTLGPETELTGVAWARNAVISNQEVIVDPTPVPEPSTLALLGTGLFVLARRLRFKR